MQFELATVLSHMLAWVLVTAAVGAALHLLSRRSVLSPRVWWAGVFVTLLVFVPLPGALESMPVSLAWVQPDWALSEEPLPAKEVAIAQTGLHAHAMHSASLLIIALISLWRVGLLIIRHRRLHRLVTGSTPYKPEHSPVPTFLTSLKRSAFATGLKHPVVALPDYFLSLTQAQQDMVLAHEYNHVKQRDPTALFVWRVLCEACWFNPFMKSLEQGFVQSVEFRCDRITLEQRGFSPTQYAQALLTCLKMDTHPATSPLSLGFTSGLSMDDYKKRFLGIFNRLSLKPAKRQWLAVAAVFAVLIPGTNIALASFNQPAEHWQFPVTTPKLSSGFGHIARIRGNRPHKGIDLRGPVGTPVYASASGQVLVADENTLSPAYGKAIVIQHAGEWQSLYAHLSELKVNPGARIKQGELIGLMGQSGRVTGSHLHFELAHLDTPVDPLPLLKSRLVTDSAMP